VRSFELPETRLGARVVLLSLLLVGLTACQFCPPSWTIPAESNGLEVGVVGDSLTWRAETGGGFVRPTPHYLTDELVGAGDDASVFGFVGFNTDALDDLTDWPSPGPDIVVVALGTNDAHNRFVPVDRYTTNLTTFLDRTPSACSVLVTVIESPAWGLDVTAPAYNQSLRDLAATRPATVVVDWTSVAAAHPEYFVEDQIHTNEAGQAAYRALMLDGVAQCAAILAPPTP
jgi:lysophospholipase L1-like esterase